MYAPGSSAVKSFIASANSDWNVLVGVMPEVLGACTHVVGSHQHGQILHSLAAETRDDLGRGAESPVIRTLSGASS
jgi:hypothetical protein